MNEVAYVCKVCSYVETLKEKNSLLSLFGIKRHCAVPMSYIDAKTLAMAQDLHRLYCLALGKAIPAWSHMTEVAALWDDLGPERQRFFIQYAKEVQDNNVKTS